jgi:hypothetical protein
LSILFFLIINTLLIENQHDPTPASFKSEHLMSRPYPDTLAISRKVLQALIALNLLMGGFITVLLIASFIAETPVMGALGVRPGAGSSALITGMRLIAVIGILAVPLTHTVLSRLRSIVDTVGAGNPFVSSNAARLTTIAWAILGLELLHFVVGVIAARASSVDNPLDLDWNFSLTRWLAVLLLFVLARVFDQGARMREDLAGTV